MSNLDDVRQRAFAVAEAERAAMRALGASDEDFEEDVFKVMVARKITDQLVAEFGDRYKAFYKKAFDEFVATASVEDLREAARLKRKGGDNNEADYLELVADYREGKGEL
jgi:hypothetical protein